MNEEMYEALKNRLPAFITDIQEIDEILRVEANEIQLHENQVFDVIEQTFPETTTWSIARLENIYGVVGSVDDSIEVRRKRIMDKLGTTVVANRFTIESLVNQYLKNPSAQVMVLHHLYHFIVDYDLADIQYFAEITAMIEKTKPAHLGYTMRTSTADTLNIKDRVFVNNRRYRKVREIVFGMPLLMSNNEVEL